MQEKINSLQDFNDKISFKEIFFHIYNAGLILVILDLVYHLASYEEGQRYSFFELVLKISANTNGLFVLLSFFCGLLFSLFFWGILKGLSSLSNILPIIKWKTVLIVTIYGFIITVFFQYWIKTVFNAIGLSGNMVSRIMALLILLFVLTHTFINWRQISIFLVKSRNKYSKMQKMFLAISVIIFSLNVYQSNIRNEVIKTEVALEKNSGRKKKNIILFTFDGMRASTLGFMGNEKKPTPFLDKLANSSIVFENAISPSTATNISISSMLYGKNLGMNYRDWFKNIKVESGRLISLPEVLKKNGYNIVAYVGTEISNPVAFDLEKYYDKISIYGKYIGRTKNKPFDSKYEQTNFALYLKSFSTRIGGNFPYRVLEWGCSIISHRIFHSLFFWSNDVIEFLDRNILGLYEEVFTDYYFYKNIPQLLDELKEPFFLHIHGILPHKFSNIPVTRNKYSNEKEIKKNLLTENLYNEYYSFVDSLFETFFGQYKSKSFFPRTMLVVSSDHGILLDKGKEAALTKSVWKSTTEEITHVPLIFYFGDSNSKNIPQPVSTIDIGPTILGYLGIGIPLVMDGISLTNYFKRITI